ncbi:MAG: exosortase A [Pseudomonadota bacterium]|nr:exosortase A [Pseudomonadota bacterium]MDL2354161.1 exosortase A [Pseudomonadota bacterium]
MYLTPPAAVLNATPRLSPAVIALMVLALLAPFALYFGTVQSIVSIWNSSETFAHGYIIMPISLWLIWRRRANFTALPPAPYWPALVLLALAGAGWLLARAGEVQVVTQYAFVAMLPLIALALLGRRLAGSLAFPLLFLLFAVPFGEIFVGPLIQFTADFTVRAVQLTGIPVLRNGTRFELPTGSWSVVDACSGVRYLISSVTIGCLYAYLTYRSTARRLLFVALSIVVPVIANGLRAYMIVMIGHLSNMKLATGVDHLIYGWLFFGLVMFVMFWIGSYWREDEAAAPRQLNGGAAPAARAAPRNMALAVLALTALWPALAHFNDQANYNARPVALAPVALSWPAAPAFSSWQPNFMAADAAVNRVTQAVPGTPPVALTILYYRNQNSAKSLISSINTMAAEEDNGFQQAGSAVRSEAPGGQPLQVREVRMQGRDGPFLVWYWYWIDQQRAVSSAGGKLLQARAKLMRRGDDGAAVMLSAPYIEQPDQARTALRAFLAAHLAPIDTALAATRGR